MKKAVLLLLVLLIVLAPCAALASGSYVCFIALNDSLLELSSQAYNQGGQYYVPAGVFADFRIYFDYRDSTSIARLYSSSSTMYFNLVTGETYDSGNNFYTSSAILRGGTVYVPVDFVCRQFGLAWSYIRGSGYGDVCRITNGAASLSDSQFLSAAQPLMAGRYNEYIGSVVEPSVTDGGFSGAESVVFLSFEGVPSETALAILDSYGLKAAFFLTNDEISQNPETVRRIVGEGHNIGIMCKTTGPETEFRAAAAALEGCAHTATVLVSSPRDYRTACEAFAGEAGLVYCPASLDGVRNGLGMTAAALRQALGASHAPLVYLRLLCCATTDANLNAMLSTLSAGSVVLAQCETSTAS